MEAAVPIDVGFVVADAEAPRLELRDQSLTLSFVDWKDNDVRAKFSDVIGVRWQEADGHLLPGERDDSVYLIEDSTWLSEHDRQAVTWTDSGHRHLRLNFNAAGVLEVLCTTVQVQS